MSKHDDTIRGLADDFIESLGAVLDDTHTEEMGDVRGKDYAEGYSTGFQHARNGELCVKTTNMSDEFEEGVVAGFEAYEKLQGSTNTFENIIFDILEGISDNKEPIEFKISDESNAALHKLLEDEEFELGDRVVDDITGFKGTLTGFVEYIDGYEEYQITPTVNNEGAYQDVKWFATNRVTKIEKA